MDLISKYLSLINPILSNDSYKLSHADQTPGNTSFTYSHLTPRSVKYMKRLFPSMADKVIVYGTQMTMEIIADRWQVAFFDRPWDVIEKETLETLNPMLGTTSQDLHRFKKLHALGYLPLRVKSMPEGSWVNANIPMMIVYNTHPDYAWLVNFIEPSILNTIYKPMSVATLTLELARIRNKYWEMTMPSDEGKEYFLHEFSYRGQAGHESAAAATSGYLLYTKGTDTMAGVQYARQYYSAPADVAASIPAFEHSTATTGIQYHKGVVEDYKLLNGNTDELAEKFGVSPRAAAEGMKAVFKVLEQMEGESQKDKDLAAGETFNLARVLIDVYPTGLFAYVSDSYDYQRLVSIIAPALKEVILARDGKFVIRPDSGNPVHVVCGDPEGLTEAERKGSIEVLADAFGTITNAKGYKQLPPQIGLVYGDGISYDRLEQILDGLAQKGFASANVCIAMGAYALAGSTRDSLGFAIKASHTIVNGQDIPVYKEPKTDMSKKSAKGRFKVVKEGDDYVLIDNVSVAEEDEGELKEIWKDGKFTSRVTFQEIQARLPL